MKKFWIQMVALSIIIFGGFYLYSDPSIMNTFFAGNNQSTQKELKVGENVLKVEIADTTDERAKGLSGRENLSSDSGMLFVFDMSKQYQFWMKGMKIPLDIIFINDGKVVDFLKNVSPPEPNQKDSNLPKLSPTVPVDMVLEVNSGYVDSRSIKIDDIVSLVK